MNKILKCLPAAFLISAFFFSHFAFAKEPPLAPDFKLSNLNKTQVSLSSYKNKKPVLLFFWTTWCPFCRKELKVLADMQPQLLKDGVEALAINVGEPQPKVESAIKSYNIKLQVLLDKDTSVAQSYGVVGVPTYILIDKKGYNQFESHTFPSEEYKKLITQ